jgi:hypothetical protein
MPRHGRTAYDDDYDRWVSQYREQHGLGEVPRLVDPEELAPQED